ncbi:MAG: saccharopine dehydrogenase [Flavobacteriales bacterium]|nr:saccharopine dehydrogenase [Flavobacteriales bacterium]|tara:strand:- start:318 stop:1646 length:1329 start_codon:yes stop_codon:yes gene_type:complete
MKKIHVIGAGRSSLVMIRTFLSLCKKNNWFLVVADFNKDLALNALDNNVQFAKAIKLDINNDEARRDFVKDSDIVISMLPAVYHILVAKDCIDYSKPMVTASYVSNDMKKLDKAAKNADVILLNEMGLDPGIDHMSAMKIINEIKSFGGSITSFKSFCGGLVHPEYDDNPWNYKFTWNPRNVVLAGQGTALYIDGKQHKYIPYNNLYKRIENLDVDDCGPFEAYANRNSLQYKNQYGLKNIDTIIRGTIRKKGFCEAWNIFIELGMTDDSYVINNSNKLKISEFTNLFLPNKSLKIKDNFCSFLNIKINSELFNKFEWLGLFSNDYVEVFNATPAQVLQSILEKKWKLNSNDKDMVVMQHQFKYNLSGFEKQIISDLVVYGDSREETAMAKTVGLPIVFAVKHILNGNIKQKGVVIPVSEEIYIPVLEELSTFGIVFREKTS